MKIKTYFSATMMALLVTGSACNNKLDIEPRQNIEASSAIKTASDVDQLLVGAYAVLGGPGLYGATLVMFPELYATDKASSAKYLGWIGTFDTPREVANKNISITNSDISRTWIQAYRAINIANTVLESLDVVTDDTQKKAFRGEALFLRATMNFELVRLFGQQWTGGVGGANGQLGIPLITKASSNDEIARQQPARKTVKEVYASIIQDLKEAGSLMLAENQNRATKYTAIALLSRVYLQQGDYANALARANEVINDGGFSLNPSVVSVFRTPNTSESIWELQQNDQNNAGNANDGLATFYANLAGGLGRADFNVSPAFKATFDPNDTRGNELIYVGAGAKPGNLACGKYTAYGQNIPLIRLSELFLTRAECNLRLGSAVGGSPADDLAEVRGRTGAAAIPAPTVNDILKERVFEFFGEGLAIHDLKRVGSPTYGGVVFNANVLVFPIPQRETSVNKNLEQNPGYGK
ncbi:RagB/SusD family nutrient uptake outer membrane protein [Chitinophaga nivalis]|uniref:RagB/SusD family nutrient uptake outer membrane protein n=1 Tax=Chitinophaga nivalis TaxID=2991709 RepID=A0ABT3IVM8_9BACT|nr:RagB/SusD family nutrient uptake outer membrane protein [Chitinophaga nivalis]MCW3462279.1 RagB/SusD family nutrient uptake outer membrane protein [Chitinophaga nivalis]MCW3488030.1 RagB/SusD family nutrient uptake outer membrane protein [Chitinophaga nivalis]